jgi:hypothetical protein
MLSLDIFRKINFGKLASIYILWIVSKLFVYLIN